MIDDRTVEVPLTPEHWDQVTKLSHIYDIPMGLVVRLQAMGVIFPEMRPTFDFPQIPSPDESTASLIKGMKGLFAGIGMLKCSECTQPIKESDISAGICPNCQAKL